MITVGLTGSIASGKNTVAAMLKARGAIVIDADEIGRKLVERGSKTLQEVVAFFGTAVLTAEGELDRKRLGQIVFDSPEKRKKLNAILHPKIIAEEWRQIRAIESESPEAVVVVNAALLIESGNYRYVDQVVVVTAEEGEVVVRVMQRDGLPRQDALLRLKAQMPVHEKAEYADHLIENNGSMAELEKKVEELFEKITTKQSCPKKAPAIFPHSGEGEKN